MLFFYASLAQSLMQMLLQGAGLSAIVAAAATFLESEIGIVDSSGAPIEWRGTDDAAQTLTAPARLLAKKTTPAADGLTLATHDTNWRAQAVVVEGDAVAWVLGKIMEKEDDLAELTLTQVAMFAALHRLEQRAARRARSETIDAIVWDLLRDNDAARAAAIDRAADIKLPLDGPLRLYLCESGLSEAGSTQRAFALLHDQVSSSIAASKKEGLRAIAMQGAAIAIVCSDQPLEDAERFAQRLALQLGKVLDDRRMIVGGSSQFQSAETLVIAYREAQIALEVARQLGRPGAIVYDRAGVVGILLSLRHEVGMQRFLELNFGRLLKEKGAKRELLLKTLRAFLDANCSHETASRRLGVHRKTIPQRLAKISELTGLDLTTHDDRLVADLSLYVYQMLMNRPEASR